MSSFWSVLLVCAMAVGAQGAWAKRLGGGLSVGKQSPNVTQRSSAAPAPQAAPQGAPANSAAAARPSTPASAAAATQRPWGAMLGGLAAGLGLAWLASSLGFGEGLAQFMMFPLLAAVMFAFVRLFLARRAPAARSSGLALQSASSSGTSQFAPATPRGYSTKNVGNDASARPWESSCDEPMIGKALNGAQAYGIPAGFDVDGFLQASKTNFVSLQDAWDRSDIASLRAMMTDGMLEQIKTQLAEREHAVGGSANKTEVVLLEAQLLGIEETDAGYMASVEFSGLIREDVSAGPNPFREIWNITRPKSGSGGWLVAGVQALQ